MWRFFRIYAGSIGNQCNSSPVRLVSLTCSNNDVKDEPEGLNTLFEDADVFGTLKPQECEDGKGFNNPVIRAHIAAVKSDWYSKRSVTGVGRQNDNNVVGGVNNLFDNQLDNSDEHENYLGKHKTKSESNKLHNLKKKGRDKNLDGCEPIKNLNTEAFSVKRFNFPITNVTNESDDKLSDAFGSLSGTHVANDDGHYVGDEGEAKADEYERRKLQRRDTAQDYAHRMKALCQKGELKAALAVLEEEMPSVGAQPDHYCYRVLIRACAKVGYTKKAFLLYNKLKSQGLQPKPVLFTSLFVACGNSPWKHDGLARAMKLREQLKEKQIVLNTIHYHAMIRALGRCGSMEGACEVVDEMVVTEGIDVTTTTINFLLQAAITDEEAGFRHFIMVWRKMRDMRLPPNLYSYNLLLRCIKDCGAGDRALLMQLLQEVDAGGKKLLAQDELSRRRQEARRHKMELNQIELEQQKLLQEKKKLRKRELKSARKLLKSKQEKLEASTLCETSINVDLENKVIVVEKAISPEDGTRTLLITTVDTKCASHPQIQNSSYILPETTLEQSLDLTLYEEPYDVSQKSHLGARPKYFSSLTNENIKKKGKIDCVNDTENSEDIFQEFSEGLERKVSSHVSEDIEDFGDIKEVKDIQIVDDDVVAQPLGSPTALALPSLLPRIPSMGSLVAVTNLNNPQDRLALVGGCEGLLLQMAADGVRPDIKSFTQLLAILPSEPHHEEEVLASMRGVGVVPDVTFCNILIRNRNHRGDLEAGKATLELLSEHRLQPDIITFGCLAVGCHRLSDAKELLITMKNMGYRPNLAIMHTLTRAALVHSHFYYALEMLNTTARHSLTPDEGFLAMLETARKRSRKNIANVQQEADKTGRKLNAREQSFMDCNRVFLLEYKKWLLGTTVQRTDHPWAQYKQQEEETLKQ